jgi:uncharacterized repeat protein (TIGR01451 family)
LNKNELNAKQIDKKEGVRTLQKKIVLIFFILGFSLALSGTVSADDSTVTAVVSQETMATTSIEQTTNNSTNNSQELPDPKLYDENGNLVGSYATIQLAYNNAATGTSTQMYTIELEENGIFTLTDFTIAKNLIFTVANGGTATIQGFNNRLIYIQSDYTVYFYNITFENGHASDGTTFHPDGYNGGAIYNEGTLYLTNCTLRNNQAGDGGAWDYGGIGGNGGAIYNTGSATITDCEIYNNRAGDGSDGFPITHSNGFQGGNGGAIYSTGTLTIIDSEMYNNLAGNGGDGVILGDGGNGGNGGAIYNTAAMTITDSMIHNNFAGDAGAGGYQVIIGGTGGTGGNGGAIYNTGTTTITDSQINENTAGDGGSGADGSNGLLSNGYTGHNGGVGGNGGAIYNTNHLEIYGTEISENEAGNGGKGGKGGNANEGLQPYNGGNGGQGGAGGNGGGVFNSNYLLINESTVTSNRSGNGGNGGNGGKGSNRWGWPIAIPSGSGGNGGAGGNSGSGAGIYHSGTYLSVTSNNLTDNQIGTPGTGGAAGLKGTGNGGSNGNAGAAGNNGTGGAIYTATAVTSSVNYNRILNNTLPDIASNDVNVNAENNWWGTNFEGSSPLNAGRVSSAKVDAEPWVILRLIVPVHIYNGIPVQSIGDLTLNSDGNPVGGYIPNGVEANFTATRGTIITPQYTLNGQAPTTYSPTSSGPATFTVKVDNQIVTVNQNVEPRAVLDFTKSVSDSTPNYGDLIHFIITVQNNGPDVTDVNVLDLLPAGLVYQSHTLNAGSYDNTTGLWSISGLSTTGGVYLDILALVNATGFFNNTATLTQSVYPQDAVNRSATLNVDPAAIISVTKTDNTVNHQADVGDTVTFTITVHNAGPDDATNVIITDTLPTGLDFVSASDGGTYDTLTRTITWTAFNLNYGAPDVTRTFVATVNELMAGNAAGITNTANVTFTEYPFTANGTDTAIYVPLADVYIHSSASNNNPYVGDTITLTFKVGNNGPDTARNVVFTLPIPVGMDYVDVLFVDQGTVTYDPVSRTITWTLGDVVVGDPTLQIRVKVLSAGNFVFAPSLITDTYDPNLNSNIQTVTINAQTVPEEVVSGQTVGMQTTGAPIAQLLLAVLMVLGGFLLPKRK